MPSCRLQLQVQTCTHVIEGNIDVKDHVALLYERVSQTMMARSSAMSQDIIICNTIFHIHFIPLTCILYDSYRNRHR